MRKPQNTSSVALACHGSREGDFSQYVLGQDCDESMTRKLLQGNQDLQRPRRIIDASSN